MDTDTKSGTRSPPPDNEIAGDNSPIPSGDLGKHFLKIVVGIFTAVAIGYSVGLILLDGLGDEAMVMIGLFAILIPLLGAPLIAMVTGIIVGLRFDSDDNSAMLTSGIGAFAGFFVMFFILLVISSLVVGNGNGDGDISDFFIPLIGFGIGVGLTGAGSTYVTRRMQDGIQ